MAYDASKEKRTEYGQTLVKDGDKAEYIKVATVQYGASAPKVDIRLWFTAETGQVCATAKGFRFPQECTANVMTHLAKTLSTDELNKFLENIATEIAGE